jgi:hypothetical protein
MSGGERAFERAHAVGEYPHELADYRAWLRQRSGPRDYLFAEARVRFEPRREDIVVSAPGLRIEGKKRADLVLGAMRIAVDGLSPAAARRLVEGMDGERCLAELSWLDRAGLAALLRAGFGRLLFAPAAVAELEAAVSSAAIVRFPASPYAVERSYWQNMAAVSRRVAILDAADAPEPWLHSLRALHVLALMGEDLATFYQPASPGADEAVHPGALFDDPVRLLRRSRFAVFLAGPRVNASLLGKDRYAARLFESLGDPDALEPRAIVEGLPWGEVVAARSERDEAVGPWFCPPRPITAQHVAALHDAWTGGDWASFHWRFVRLHPFRCGNQSLAMALVNARLGTAAIPQLILDHWALRLGREPYRRLFARAQNVWASAGEPRARLAALVARRRDWEALVARLERGGELESAAERHLALLEDGGPEDARGAQ